MGCRLLDVNNSTLLKEIEAEGEKREPEVHINRKPKRVRLGIDRENVVNGQTKRRCECCVKCSVLERDERVCSETPVALFSNAFGDRRH